MRVLYNLRTRIAAFLLAMIMLFLSLPSYALSLIETEGGAENNTAAETTEDYSKVSVLHDGAGKSIIELAEDGKEILTSFVNGIEPEHRTWQILVPDDSKWVNIYGCNAETLAVSYAMVGSMLDENSRAYIRSSVVADGETYVSAPVGISVVYKAAEEESEPVAAPVMMKAVRAASGTEDLETFTVVINYIFDNGTIAFEPYGASVAKGSDFYRVVDSPVVVGYEPFRRIDGNYVSAEQVEIDLKNITSNVTINVIYEPAIVDFTVHHHLQNVNDDEYSATPDYTTSFKALTGSVVSDNLAMTESQLPGFKALAYERLTVAADGSTVVEIRYDRNYYLVNFDMQGGYGVEPFYVRYETLLGANDPVRHGYVFDGWELALYGDDRAPTVQEASKYDINSRTITTPDANLTYRAKWVSQLTQYTMVFWKENIDDNGFSYWGFLDGLTAMSGSYVSGSDRVGEVGGIDDESCFTYNDTLTDKNVIVEGDGSTVVNVYYSRNRYAITFKAKGLCTIEVGHIHSDECYDLICNKGHVHTSECNPVLICTKTVHTAHDDSCIICGKDAHVHGSDCCGYESHEHSTSCYSGVGNAASPANAPTNVEDGYIFAVRSFWRYNYYIYIKGTWYSYTGGGASSGDIVNPSCGMEEHQHGTVDCDCKIEVHEHTDDCYSDTLHSHDADLCYSYSCDADTHVHGDGCYVLDCSIPTGHTHNNTCRSASSTNTVKIAHYKYQANLEDMWPITDDNGKTYNSGERWSPSGSDTYSAVLVYIANMPGEDFTLTLNESKNDTYTMNYYLEVLPGESYDVEYQGKYFAFYTEVKANYNYITEAEDFFEINGYYKFASNPAFSGGQIDINGGGVVNFYYGRIIDHYLQFESNGIILNTHTQHGIPYGQSLKEYNFVPPYPDSLEPEAFVFGGWYTSSGCYDGTEVDWDSLTMGEGDLLLYAKWSPVSHTVEVYTDNTYAEQVGDTQYVLHGHFASAPTDTVTNGGYIFQGWFYSDVVDGVVVEKAFVFTGIPIVRDLKIYAKWSSHVTVNYEINYVLEATGERIADTTVGSSIAGHNKTFYAKAGNELYPAFREGYYPVTSSHTIMMNPKDGTSLVFEFKYVYVESMPYLVRYLDANGQTVCEDKRVMDNNLSVVTETFVKVDKMMPDAYQKRLVLSATAVDEDNDNIYDSNVITFNYTSDEEHAYYKVIHYVEHIGADGYREYRSEDAVGIIGNEYSISVLDLSGFSYVASKTTVNGAYAPTTDGKVTSTLTSDGLLIELYYDRVEVDYTVRYLDSITGLSLYEDKRGEGIFGEQIVEHAISLNNIGYTLVSESVKQLHLSADASLNVIEFYYQESSVSLKYVIVGSPEGGELSQSSENVNAVTGVPSGSVPMIKSGYHLVGWFLDEGCLTPAPDEWINPDNNGIVPKNDGVWLRSVTYYAKVDPDFTTLRIATIGCNDVDDGQIFIFNVKGTSTHTSHLDFNVTVVGNGSVTVSRLPIGSYTVTELTAWSYRYTPDSVSKSITLSVNGASNHLLFSHIRTGTKWLDGNANELNIYN